ncbi:MAG: class II fructose-bisphosphate aldolase [Anaerolineales bacterium]|nr:class II fructose-bisphosphate aldolase [Anaerolineales bacterium]
MSVSPQQIVEKYYGDAASIGKNGTLAVRDTAKVTAQAEPLARASAFGSEADRSTARWLIWETALALGIFPASINDLYLARGKGAIEKSFTVPAMNLRVMSFDSARAAFRAGLSRQVGPLIYEIARSEMTYTDQRPSEYTSSILAAAIAEGWKGPVFIQGDHFQVSAKKYAANPQPEIKAIEDLIREAVGAGFYNIDIDTSTLVDLSKPTIREQQAVNSKLCADFTAFIRSHQPAGVQISIGGEIGEVGGHNSTEEELRAYLDLYGEELKRMDPKAIGLSKISLQTGTSHGGVVLPDGTIAQVAVDFDTLKKLSLISRKDYGLGGAVQHGASTLPDSAFCKFPENETCEVHLATNFQNIAFENVPPDLRSEVDEWVKKNCADERKEKDTEEQFLYKSRKKAVGPFKKAFWEMPAANRKALNDAWEKKFGFLFDQLQMNGTRSVMEKFVKPVAIHKSPADFGAVGAEDASAVKDLAD